MNLRVFLLAFCILVCRCQTNDDLHAVFGKVYDGQTKENGELVVFKYNVTKDQVVRVWLQCLHADQHTPLLAVFRGRISVTSLQIPLILQSAISGFSFHCVARNLCPFGDVESVYRIPDEGDVSIELSSASITPLNFSLNATLVDHFDLHLHDTAQLRASPSQPHYVRFRMPDGVDTVMVQVESPDTLCMVVSIQPIGCPVYDLDNNVEFTGSHQTMTHRAAMPITKEQYSQFYIVFVVAPSDSKCDNYQSVVNMKRLDYDRVKSFNVTVSSSIGSVDYVVPILLTIGAIFVLYVLAIAFVIALDVRDNRLIHSREPLLSNVTEDQLSSGGQYGAILDNETSVSTSDALNGSLQNEDEIVIRPDSPDSQYDTYDRVNDAEVDKEIVRSKVKLTVADLARKPWKQRERKNTQYIWNLLTLSLFYSLPVVQLVYIWQMSVVHSGNQDLCYYNFLCARPLFSIYAFNNVFSNIGYILLGLLLLILVKHREIRMNRLFPHDETTDEPSKYGIPRHFGIFYAIGIALMMEGVMSACYHVCPSNQNYQFDTAFMYMLAALGMLKVYQTRHPDINASSHVAYALMAAVILLAMIGVFVNEVPFWSVFSVFFILILLGLSLEFYYKGQWHIGVSAIYRVRHELRSSTWFSCICPAYPDRMIFLLVGNLANIALLVFGFVQRYNFPTFLLAVFIANLIIYVVFYVVMKLKFRETLRLRPVICILLSMITWAASLAFFSVKETNWNTTPAKSREQNGECILLNFYDYHDVWHILSSVSLFLSFLIILNIDDDLAFTRQTNINVF